jgi:long-chain acyl-CoA synthetase
MAKFSTGESIRIVSSLAKAANYAILSLTLESMNKNKGEEVTSMTKPWLKSYPATINWAMPLPAQPAHELLDAAAAQFPAKPCLDFLGKRTSYADVADLMNRFAVGLQQLGVVKGTRVGLCLPNCPYYVLSYFAILKIGGVVVNFNPLYAERELIHQINDSGIETMITLDLALMHDKLMKLVGTTSLRRLIIGKMSDILPFPKNILFGVVKAKEVAKWQVDNQRLSWRDLLGPMGSKPTSVAIDPHRDLAVLQYTGGTTGISKGAMLSHQNIYTNAAQAAVWFEGAVPGQEKMLAVIPFFHVFAMTAAMNLAIHLAAEIIMLPRFDLRDVLKTITHKKPTLFPAVPTIYTAIVNHAQLSKYSLSSIRRCISGGAPLPIEIKQRFEKLTGCTLVEGYGLSETSPVATCNPLKGVNKTGSIGLPLPNTEISIRSLEDPTREMPQGERGEVCIKGPQVMLGYWNKPEETDKVMLPDGWLRTGDVGVMDEDGYFSIVDRIKDMILYNGYNVYPRNVEEAIYLHPAVAECIVIGIPDAKTGQAIKAFIKLKPEQSLTAEALGEFLKDKLSAMERPKQVEFRAELPKTMIGKLSKKALVEEEAAKK